MTQPYVPPQRRGSDPADPLISTDFSGWWQRSFRLLRTAWRPMLVVQLIVTVPALAALLPALLTFTDGKLTTAVRVLLPAAVLAFLLLLLSQLATQQVVIHIATARPGNPVAPALLAGAKRLPMLIGWCLLSIPVLIVALVLCFFPVIYVGAALAVLPVVVLLEKGAGIGRCFQLFHANIGISISRLATLAGLSVAAAMVVAMLQTLTGTVLDTVLEAIYSIITYVVLTPLLVTTYADMRARRESFTTADLVTPKR